MYKICARNKRLLLIGIVFFIIFSISGIYALTEDVINNTESTISTSYVDIKLEEYQNGEPYIKENEVVMPGETISLNSKINNLGIDCYVRAKISYTLNGTEYNEFDYINGDYKNWNKKDKYYYYTQVLKQNEIINLFDTIQVPNEILNESSGDKIIVHIIVEAVQSKNFDGNWDEVDIKKAVDRSYSMDSEGKSEIIYENNADKYIDIGDGLFDNLGGLLPGDSITDQFTIDNNSSNRIKYYLSINTKNLTPEEIDLLENINISIKNNKGEELINGKLTDINNLLLGIYNSGSNGIITITISLPSNLDNEFSKIATKIIWVFSVEEENTSINPETWDLRFDWSITLFMFSALGLLIVMILEKREKDNIENNKKKGRN